MFLLGILAILSLTGDAQKITTIFEQSNGRQTPDYFQIINWWQHLDKASAKVSMQTMGLTDAGYPLHLITVANQPIKNFETARKQNKRIILINNGIHPGEPDGIDASMLLVRDIAENKYALPNDIVLAIIPVYNIGGCLNRSAFYRVDQDGPEAFGSRGNAQKLDLNRDFIKCDSRNAISFFEIFHLTAPDVFLDNHVSNGADYQHIITLVSSQHNKLGGIMGAYMHNKFEPGIFSLMKQKGYDMIPYVNHFGRAVDEGWQEFWDSPRYGSGYGSLWNTFCFVPETHMLKPYPQRVKATYALMQSFIEFTHTNADLISKTREQAKQKLKTQSQFPVKFVLDSTKYTIIEFKGYKGLYKKSEVTGLQRLYYDRQKPYTKQIPFYNFYTPVSFVTKPKAYIIPQGWWKVIERLKANKVVMKQLKKDTLMDVEFYTIKKYNSSARPYESHHANSAVEVEAGKEKHSFSKGDWYIEMNQEANRFLIETLEPTMQDSYFVWNFFDGILNRKEWFSDYVFEDEAVKILQNNPQLQKALAAKRNADTSFAKNADAQLEFIFDASPYKEPDFMRYPVYRIL